MIKKIFIISLGGSLIAPREGIDTAFLKNFKKLILDEIKKGKKFFIIAGGGNTAREYQKAARQFNCAPTFELDWLGIHASRLNSRLLKILFYKEAYHEIIKNPTLKIKTNKKIIIGGGWKPGWSTDFVAVSFARTYGIKTVINLSNIDYAYDKDPKKFSDAQKIKKINWLNFRKIVGTKWLPGLSKPFDPIASQKAAGLNLRVIIMNGKKLNNLRNCLDGKNFKGTLILN